MKTLFFITMILLLNSCRTVQKASEDQYVLSESHDAATGINLDSQSLAATQVKNTNLSSLSSSGPDFERLIEEQVLEYRIPREDSNTAGNLNFSKLVHTRRTIKERGKQIVLGFEQSTTKDSLQKQESAQSRQEFQSESNNDLTLVQKRRLTKRTGIPWYVWAAGGAGITLGFWLKKRYQLNRAQYHQIREQ